MSNLLVEIGNTALKAAWSDGMTLGKTFRYQGEKWMDFTLSLTRKEKPLVMVVCSVYPLSESDRQLLSQECRHFLLLDKAIRNFFSVMDFLLTFPMTVQPPSSRHVTCSAEWDVRSWISVPL